MTQNSTSGEICFKTLIFFLLAMILQGCAGSGHSNTKKLLNNLNTELKRNHNLDNGYLIALYGLAEVKKNTAIFNQEYVKIINNSASNKLFLRKIKARDVNQEKIGNRAHARIYAIKRLLLTINAKYNILSRSQAAKLSTQSKPHTNIFAMLNAEPSGKRNKHLDDLRDIDKIIENIPVMLPEHAPRITSHYGNRKHPIKRQMKFHTGIDLVTKKSGPIYAAASGRVRKTGVINGYGKIIEIEHHHGIMTRYTHLSSIAVQVGESIVRGQAIALQGSTGNVTSEHLHFEIWIAEKHVDPYDFISHQAQARN